MLPQINAQPQRASGMLVPLCVSHQCQFNFSLHLQGLHVVLQVLSSALQKCRGNTPGMALAQAAMALQVCAVSIFVRRTSHEGARCDSTLERAVD